MSLVVREPSSLVEVHDQCATVETWAAACESVAELRDASNRLAAINEYLERTSTEGRARVAAAMRRLEVRIGQLLGPPSPGRPSTETSVMTDVSRHQRQEFREMAEHPEVVEAVIADSTDEQPASRRRVTQRIAEATKAHPIATPSFKSREAVDARVSKAREMAAEGYTSRQIAKEIGISAESIAEFRKRHGIEVPADAVIGKTRAHDSNRILSETVTSLEGLVLGLDLVELADLDREQVDGWATSLSNSLRSLNRLAKQLKEMTRVEE